MSGKASNCDGEDMTDTTFTELHHRSADGIEVSLLWSRVTNALTVAVEDSRSGMSFEIPVVERGDDRFIRASFQGYNDTADLERLKTALFELLG